jgi:hypothetical protein
MSGRLVSVIALGWMVAACGGRRQPEAPPPPSHDAAVVEDEPAAGCTADEGHCCRADGVAVVPGGCQPSFPDGVEPNVERAPDGSCQPVPCTLRCLPETAQIATPTGDRPISGLAVGDEVWTRDAAGQRVAVRIARIQALPVTEPHTVVEVTLADGRVVRASDGHPDGSGGRVGALRAGDPLDGSTVGSVVRVAYEGARTWDLLPDGPTGTYWADGVLLGSTLAR